MSVFRLAKKTIDLVVVIQKNIPNGLNGIQNSDKKSRFWTFFMNTNTKLGKMVLNQMASEYWAKMVWPILWLFNIWTVLEQYKSGIQVISIQIPTVQVWSTNKTCFVNKDWLNSIAFKIYLKRGKKGSTADIMWTITLICNKSTKNSRTRNENSVIGL